MWKASSLCLSLAERYGHILFLLYCEKTKISLNLAKAVAMSAPHHWPFCSLTCVYWRDARFRLRASQISFTSVSHVRIFAFLMFWFGLNGESCYQHVAKFHHLQFRFVSFSLPWGKWMDSRCTHLLLSTTRCLPGQLEDTLFCFSSTAGKAGFLGYFGLSGTSDYSIKFYFLEQFLFYEDIICLSQWIKMWPCSCVYLNVRWSVSA